MHAFVPLLATLELDAVVVGVVVMPKQIVVTPVDPLHNNLTRCSFGLVYALGQCHLYWFLSFLFLSTEGYGWRLVKVLGTQALLTY